VVAPEEKAGSPDPALDDGATPPGKSGHKAKKGKKSIEPRDASKEKTDSKGLAVGLKNNIYDFRTEQAEMKHKIQRVEQSIFSKKKEWITANTEEWLSNTPFIYDYHKEADKKLHAVRPNQTFVSVKRAQQKLPNFKELVVPFMTEAIDE